MSYAPLPTTDPASIDEKEKSDLSSFRTSPKKMNQNLRSLLRYPLLWLSLTITIVVSLLYFLPPHPTIHFLPQRAVYLCGDSPSEARANGCQFDVISFSWLPPACSDAELMGQFLSQRNRTWYSDDGSMTPVSHTEVSSGRHEVLHVSWDYHFSHCTYMWQKLHRAILKGGPVDGYIGNMQHTAHCADLLLRQDEMLASGDTTVIFVKYPSCGEGMEMLGDEEHSGWYRVENGRRVSSAPALAMGAHHHR